MQPNADDTSPCPLPARGGEGGEASGACSFPIFDFSFRKFLLSTFRFGSARFPAGG
jgi:hypothetical protein